MNLTSEFEHNSGCTSKHHRSHVSNRKNGALHWKSAQTQDGTRDKEKKLNKVRIHSAIHSVLKVSNFSKALAMSQLMHYFLILCACQSSAWILKDCALNHYCFTLKTKMTDHCYLLALEHGTIANFKTQHGC